MAIIDGTENFTNGPYEIPDAKETGNSVFDKLEEFMERMATHTHNGSDSNSITLNIAKAIQDLQGNGVDFTWTLVSPGRYRALVDVAAGSTFDDNVRTYYYRVDGGAPQQFYPSVERLSNTQYYLYTNVVKSPLDNPIQNINLRIVTI